MYKHYHGFQKKILSKYNLLNNKELTAKYDSTLKINLNLSDHIHQQIYFLNYYDKRGILFIKQFLKEGYTFIDIGANIGCYSLIAAKYVGKKGRVICFEAIKETYNSLNENIKINNLENTYVFNNAIYNRNQKLTLHVANKYNSGMSSIHNHSSEAGITQQCEAITLDDFISKNETKRIDLIKIDIEGAEIYALQGMLNVIKQFKPTILIELSDSVLENTNINKTEIIKLLIDLGYTQHGIDKNGELISLNEAEKDYYNFVFN